MAARHSGHDSGDAGGWVGGVLGTGEGLRMGRLGGRGTQRGSDSNEDRLFTHTNARACTHTHIGTRAHTDRYGTQVIIGTACNEPAPL